MKDFCLELITPDGLKTACKGMLGVASSMTGVAVSVGLSHIEIILRIAALVGGIIVTFLTGRSILRDDQKKRRLAQVQLQREESALCAECRKGERPAHCPLPDQDRPPGCPHFPKSKILVLHK